MNLVKIVGPLLMATTLLSGCATLPKSATPYTPDTTATPDTATIYLYRSGGFVGGALSPNIAANGVPLADLPAGGYFIYHALPGEVEFSAHTEAKTSVTIDAKAGQTYYVKDTIGVGFFVGHPHLVVVTNDVGDKEIRDCKLIPAAIPTAVEVASAQAHPTAAGSSK
jgi:hypothetical protein